MVIDFEKYLADSKLREDAVADLFLRLDKNADSRVVRARQHDRKLQEYVGSGNPDGSSSFPSVPVGVPGNDRSRSKNRHFYLVGPELAGMMEDACRIAGNLLEAGCQVTLVTRVHASGDVVLKGTPQIPRTLMERYPESFALKPVRPLESFARCLTGKQGTVVSFYPPLSAGLVLADIPHILILRDRAGSDLLSSSGSGLLSAEDLQNLLYLPDCVLSMSPENPQARRTVFPFSTSLLAFVAHRKSLPVPPPPVVPDVSACIIARDEEGMIEDCLLSLVPVAEETIVNDTGSVDGTARVAGSLGATVFQTGWEDDFSRARNACLERASCMYAFSIDADERVAPDSRSLFKRSLLPGKDGYAHGFLVLVKNILGDGVAKDCQLLRIHLNKPAYRYSGKVHEQIQQSMKGPVRVSPIVLEHLGYSSLVSSAKDKRKRNILLLGEALEAGENRAYYEFQLGVEMRNTGNFAEAVPLLRRAFGALHPQSPSRPVAAMALIESYAALGRLDEMLAFWEKVKRDIPGLLEVGEVAAEGLINGGRAEEALALLEEASRLPAPAWVSETEGVRTFVLECLLCKAQVARNDLERAMSHMMRALSSNPDHGPSQRLLVSTWPERAVELLRDYRASTVRPAVLESLRLGRIDLAMSIATEFSAADPGSCGEVHLARREFEEASRWFLKSTDRWDRMRGQILLFLKEPSVSRDGFEETVEDILSGRPSSRGRIPEVVKALGFLLDVGAIELFEKGLKALSSCDDPEFFAGLVLFEKGFKELAADFLVTSLKKGKRPETLAMLAEVAWERKLYQECVAFYGELESFRPLAREESLRCMSALTNLGRLDEAANLLEKSVAIYGSNESFERVRSILKRMRQIAAVTSRPGSGSSAR